MIDDEDDDELQDQEIEEADTEEIELELLINECERLLDKCTKTHGRIRLLLREL